MILNEIGGADTDKISVKTLISATKRDNLTTKKPANLYFRLYGLSVFSNRFAKSA